MNLTSQQTSEPARPPQARAKKVQRPRCTKEEHAQRVRFATVCLSRLMRRGQILPILMRKFLINPRTADRVLHDARAQLRGDLALCHEDHVADVSAYLASIVQDATEDTRNKLEAIRQYCQLLGLYKPARVQQVPPAPPAPFMQQQMEQARGEVAGLPPEELCPPPPGVPVDLDDRIASPSPVLARPPLP
jgi:hypothetical protein